MLIYLGGATPGMVCGWVVLRTSFFATEQERAVAVKYLGFYGPLGAWVTIWGSLTMLVSAPFDNWWHDAYGLDVEILSPPHTLLALGMYGVAVGALLLVLAQQNRAASQGANESKTATRLFLFALGVLLAMASIILTEKSYPNAQHTRSFYLLCGITYSFYLALASRASRSRWGATAAAAWYMAIVGGMVWILPLFKAQPMLAPIYLKVDHMVPPVFPFLLVLPALAIDLIHRALGMEGGFWRRCVVGAALGAAFFLVFVGVQWNFSAFLMHSEGAKNWFFSAHQQWPYFARPGPWRGEFWTGNGTDVFNVKAALLVLVCAMVAARVGIGMGGWMRTVRR